MSGLNYSFPDVASAIGVKITFAFSIPFVFHLWHKSRDRKTVLCVCGGGGGYCVLSTEHTLCRDTSPIRYKP